MRDRPHHGLAAYPRFHRQLGPTINPERSVCSRTKTCHATTTFVRRCAHVLCMGFQQLDRQRWGRAVHSQSPNGLRRPRECADVSDLGRRARRCCNASHERKRERIFDPQSCLIGCPERLSLCVAMDCSQQGRIGLPSALLRPACMGKEELQPARPGLRATPRPVGIPYSL